MDLHLLTKPASKCLHEMKLGPAEARDALLALESVARSRTVVRVIRGDKCTTTSNFFDEVAAALQFPLYFGANWDAFHDCLADLRWLHASAVVLLIVEAEHFLQAALADQLAKFVEVVNAAAKHLGKGSKERTAVALHVVAQGMTAESSKRWHAAGAKV